MMNSIDVCYEMATILMNSESSKLSDHYRLLLNISDLISDINLVFLMNQIQYQIFKNILSI